MELVPCNRRAGNRTLDIAAFARGNCLANYFHSAHTTSGIGHVPVMVIRRMLPIWVWGMLSVIFLAVSIGISTVYATWKVQTTVQNECSALEYLIHHPSPHATKGATIFFNDVKVWAHRDGCG